VAESEPPEETSEPEDKPKTVPLSWLGTNNPMPSQYRTRVVEKRIEVEKRVEVPIFQPPQIIKEPSLSTNLGIALRDWVKSRANSFWGNLRSDVAFCREAFRTDLSESRWSGMTAAVTHVHKLLNWALGLGVPAGIIALYIAYIYPLAGPVGTVIVVLSLLVLASLVTIRVTRKLYEKTLTSLLETQGQVASLTAASKDHARLIEAARTAMATARREIAVLEQQQIKPKVDITKKRTVMDITPEELVELFKNNSKERVKELLTEYLGKWMYASGVTIKHYMYGQEADETTVVLKTSDVQVYARFSEWRQASRVLHGGNGVRVKVLGRIDEIQEGLVNLAECEVVEMKLPPPK